MAAWCAQNVKRHLKIPVALITNNQAQAKKYKFDQIIVADAESGGTRHFEDYDRTVTWHNAGRTDAYALTPWDQTLVLDADYVVASNQLQSVIEVDQDFLAHRWAYDVTGCNTFKGLNYFGNNCMPMWWATVIMFRKSRQAELIFNSMQMIRNNRTHNRNMYKNTNATYRNDHALSIALGIVNGHTLNHADIPWALASLTPDHKLTQLDQDSYRVDFVNTENNLRWITLTQDFHAMGKQQLGEIVASHC
jgi:hypothetical protein